ncbi:hypothetical protein NLJ89_g185 [Agrocybe chaxingu]|uniref:Uncharacterized protein n=1 Tax=Agrocybe chaxingu TaxID=84603 RepID=A0A9W8N2C8_9AGAR|nr:hypothetical protein NLJ89_g185 [Agrocybe chaxingu]
MFFSVSKAFTLVAAAAAVVASPVAKSRRDLSTISSVSPISFNLWGGIQSLAGFDNFFGLGNFNGFNNQQIIVVNQQPVCQVQQLLIVQQQLAIIQEFSKQLILSSICDIETQVLVLEQFRGGLRNFRGDLRRITGRNAGFDANIALLFGQLLNQDGSINFKNFGFNGIDIGRQLVVPTGFNWVDNRTPQNIDEILRILASQSTSVQVPVQSNINVTESSSSEAPSESSA